MPLVPQEKLQTEYWLHRCSERSEGLTYTSNGAECFRCKKTEEQAAADGEVVEQPQ